MDSESFVSPPRPAQTPANVSYHHTFHNHHHLPRRRTDPEYQSPGAVDSPRGDVASALFPLQADSESESDLEEQVREFRARTGDRGRLRLARQRAHFHAQQLEYSTDLGLAALFSQTSLDHDSSSDWESSDESSHESDEAARADFDTANNSDWSNLGNLESQPEPPRSFLGQSLLNARAETRRLLLLAVLQIKIESPNITADVAWQSLINWLRRDRVIVRDNEVVTTWMFAFNEPAGAHFRSVFESSVESVRAMWNEEYD